MLEEAASDERAIVRKQMASSHLLKRRWKSTETRRGRTACPVSSLCCVTCMTRTNDFVSKQTLSSHFNGHMWFEWHAHLAARALKPLALGAARGTVTATQPANEARNAACHTSSTCLGPSSITSTHHPNPSPMPTHAAPWIRVRLTFFCKKCGQTVLFNALQALARYNWESM